MIIDYRNRTITWGRHLPDEPADFELPLRLGLEPDARRSVDLQGDGLDLPGERHLEGIEEIEPVRSFSMAARTSGPGRSPLPTLAWTSLREPDTLRAAERLKTAASAGIRRKRLRTTTNGTPNILRFSMCGEILSPFDGRGVLFVPSAASSHGASRRGAWRRTQADGGRMCPCGRRVETTAPRSTPIRLRDGVIDELEQTRRDDGFVPWAILANGRRG
jgi:hypothetical protein